MTAADRRGGTGRAVRGLALAALILALLMPAVRSAAQTPAGTSAETLAATPAPGAGLQALARVLPGGLELAVRDGGLVLGLALDRAVPYRVFMLAGPPRLVVDFAMVDFAALEMPAAPPAPVAGLRRGLFRPGWSRLVLVLNEPMRIVSAGMRTSGAAGGAGGGGARLDVRLAPTDAAGLAAEVAQGPADPLSWPGVVAVPPAAVQPAAPRRRPMGERKVVVAIDPGHGGFDPGAQAGGRSEADLVLTMARVLKEKLLISGRYEAFLTRSEDRFLSLEGRITAARAGGADVLISLHADALERGRASGVTVYTLSETASDQAAARLAAAHDRADLLAGVDLNRQDDTVAAVLMDMAMLETRPRAERLADALVRAIARATGRQRPRPRLSAGFTVLRAPDIPSVLIELGFISNPVDRGRLADPKWRLKIADAIVRALDEWSVADAAEARLLRK